MSISDGDAATQRRTREPPRAPSMRSGCRRAAPGRPEQPPEHGACIGRYHIPGKVNDGTFLTVPWPATTQRQQRAGRETGKARRTAQLLPSGGVNVPRSNFGT
jgi:hypothetical protein